VHNESESKTELGEIDTRDEFVTTQWQDSDEEGKNVDSTGTNENHEHDEDR
jgi:hypothetical protein